MTGFAAAKRTPCERTERLEDVRRGPDIDDSEQTDDDEPDHHDRPEQPADARRAAPLNHEQADQDGERDRQDEVLEGRRHQLEALHGRKHRDRRGDDAVAVEQCRADDAEQHQHLNARAVGYPVRRHQGQQRQDPAFAVVVGAQDEDDVFERDHRHQRPEDERDHPKHVGRGRWGVADGTQGDGKRVERACPDIAEHDAKRGEREERAAPFMRQLAGMRQLAAIRPVGGGRDGRGAADGSIHKAVIPPKGNVRPAAGGRCRPARSRSPPPQPAWRVMMAAVADFVAYCSHLTSPENGHFTMNSGPRALASPWFAWNLCA